VAIGAATEDRRSDRYVQEAVSESAISPQNVHQQPPSATDQIRISLGIAELSPIVTDNRQRGDSPSSTTTSDSYRPLTCMNADLRRDCSGNVAR
jgi:hypothetical protein